MSDGHDVGVTSVQLDHVSVNIGTTSILDDVSLNIGDGAFVGVLGPSGAGKTSILRIIAGLATPSKGEVFVGGESMRGVRPERRGVVMVFQRHALFPYRTVAENVAFGLSVKKVPKAERSHRVDAALASVGMAEFGERWPDQLSGGQQQRAAIARALAVQPRVLLLDEPMAHLDTELAAEVVNIISELHHTTEMTTIMVSHHRSEMSAIADQLAVVIGGQIRQFGSAQEVMDHPRDDDVARAIGTHPE